MYMKEIAECQRIIDSCNPFFVERVATMTDEELVGLESRLNKEKEIAVLLRKPLDDVNQRIMTLNAIRQIRTMSELLKEYGEAPIPGGLIVT